MIYYLLPTSNINIYDHLECDTSNNNNPFLNMSLSKYLNEVKLKIDYYEKEWDIYKKYTNPFEYINTIVSGYNLSVAKYKPLSRSFFKMIEILNFFNIITFTGNVKTFHLAEGPGGFIEAVIKKRKNPGDLCIGMTLIDEQNDPNIPSWKKSEQFLKDNPNVHIECGVTNTGDILNIDNFKYVYEKYKNSIDLVTGDGGFDFSIDFNNQEGSIFKLLMAQIFYAICVQKEGGTFVLKIFDCFLYNTIDLLYFLSCMYKEVFICKPQTSRYANSEKYVICKNFRGNYDFDKLQNIMHQILNSAHIYRILNIKLPSFFTAKLEEINSIFGQQQLENINTTLRIIESKTRNDKIDTMVQSNISKCIKWCQKNNIEYHIFSKKIF